MRRCVERVEEEVRLWLLGFRREVEDEVEGEGAEEGEEFEEEEDEAEWEEDEAEWEDDEAEWEEEGQQFEEEEEFEVEEALVAGGEEGTSGIGSANEVTEGLTDDASRQAEDDEEEGEEDEDDEQEGVEAPRDASGNKRPRDDPPDGPSGAQRGATTTGDAAEGESGGSERGGSMSGGGVAGA